MISSGAAETSRVLSILFLDPCKFGSMEEYTVCLSRELERRGWRSGVVFSEPVRDPVLSHFAGTNARLFSFQRGRRLGPYRQLVGIQRQFRADVVHFHFFNQFSILPILLRLAGAKVVVFTDHVRQPQRIGFRTRMLCRLWDRVIFPLFGTKVLAISEHIKRTLVGCYQMRPERIQVIPNGVNLGRFVVPSAERLGSLRAELGIGPQIRVVVCASNLRPEKGIDDLLRAAKQVTTSAPEALFLVVGEGPEAEPLRKLANQLGIQANVQFLGLRSDVHDLMAMADVVATPSVWQEPAGLVVIEGMAVGRPVVATRVGGIPEYLADGQTGILVDPGQPDQLAQALLRVLSSPAEAEKMGRAGRKRAEELFTMERWVNDTIRLYERALGAH